MKSSDQHLSRGHPSPGVIPSGDLEECIVTLEDTRRELDQIETLLASELGVARARVRHELLTREVNGMLKHSQLIADWHQTYSCYLDWLTHL